MKTKTQGLAVTAAIGALLLGAQAVQAMPIDNGAYTTSLGLDWLDVTTTRDRSFNSVLTSTQDMNDELYGWRYATTNEFDALMADFGFRSMIPSATCDHGYTFCDTYPIELPNISNAIAMLGDNLDAYWEITYPDDYADVNEGNGYTIGMTSDRYVGVIYDVEYSDKTQVNSGVNNKDRINSHQYQLGADRSDYKIGSYLVREVGAVTGPIANVPEPASLALLGLGLAGIGATRRRKQ